MTKTIRLLLSATAVALALGAWAMHRHNAELAAQVSAHTAVGGAR